MSLYLTGAALDFILYIPIMLLVFISFYYFQEKVEFGLQGCSYIWPLIFRIVFGYNFGGFIFISTTLPYVVVDKKVKNKYLLLMK